MWSYQYMYCYEMNINKTNVILLAVRDEQIILRKYEISDSQNPNVKYAGSETKNCEQKLIDTCQSLKYWNNIWNHHGTQYPRTGVQISRWWHLSAQTYLAQTSAEKNEMKRI